MSSSRVLSKSDAKESPRSNALLGSKAADTTTATSQCASVDPGAASSHVAGAVISALVGAGVSKKVLIDAIGNIVRTAHGVGSPEAISLQVPKEVKSRLQRVLPSLMLQHEHSVSHIRQLVQQPARHGLPNSARSDIQLLKVERDRALHRFESCSNRSDAEVSADASVHEPIEGEDCSFSERAEAASGSDDASPAQLQMHFLHQIIDSKFEALVAAIDQCLDAKMDELFNQSAAFEAFSSSLQAADASIQKLEESLRSVTSFDAQACAALKSLEQKFDSFTTSAVPFLVPADRVPAVQAIIHNLSSGVSPTVADSTGDKDAVVGKASTEVEVELHGKQDHTMDSCPLTLPAATSMHDPSTLVSHDSLTIEDGQARNDAVEKDASDAERGGSSAGIEQTGEQDHMEPPCPLTHPAASDAVELTGKQDYMRPSCPLTCPAATNQHDFSDAGR